MPDHPVLPAVEHEGARAVCPSCRGAMIPGTVGLTVLGAPKFTYKVGHLEVSVALHSFLCESCGEVTLRAPDTAPIRRAARAVTPSRLRSPFSSPLRSAARSAAAYQEAKRVQHRDNQGEQA